MTALSFGKWVNSLSGIYKAVILFWNALTVFNILLGSLSLPWSCKFTVFMSLVMSVRNTNCNIQCGSFNSGSCFPLHSRKVRLSGRRLRIILQLTAGTVDGSEVWRRWNSPHVQPSASCPESHYFWVLIPVPLDVWCNGNWWSYKYPLFASWDLWAPSPCLACLVHHLCTQVWPSFDQLIFLSLKNVRRAFKMSLPLVWPRRGSKHNNIAPLSLLLWWTLPREL